MDKQKTLHQWLDMGYALKPLAEEKRLDLTCESSMVGYHGNNFVCVSAYLYTREGKLVWQKHITEAAFFDAMVKDTYEEARGVINNYKEEQ